MEKIKGGLNRRRAAVLAPLFAVGLVLSGGTGAFAAGTDPIGDKFTDLTSEVTTVYIPAFIVLALAGTLVFMGVRWVKKAAASS